MSTSRLWLDLQPRLRNTRPPLAGGASPCADRPGDDFNQRGDVRAVLAQAGWTLAREGSNEYWRRPGKDSGWSATLRDRVFYVFTLTLTDTRIEEIPGEGKAWNAWAIYTIVQATAFRATGENVFQFDTGGNTQQVVQAIKHGATVSCAGATSTPDFKGAINVNGDGDIGGVSVPSPAFRFSITLYKAKSQVNQAYLEGLYKATGKVNSADIVVRCNGESMSFAAGELLLEGASGGLRGNEDWEITLRFAASPNVADVCADWDPSVKPAAAVPKKGWEYAWVYYEEFYDQSSSPPRRVKRPQTVNIEQVYYTTPFAALGLP